MPRFFFDSLIDGDAFYDNRGSDMLNEAYARREAEKALVEMLGDSPAQGPHRTAEIWVRGEDRRILIHAVASLTISDALVPESKAVTSAAPHQPSEPEEARESTNPASPGVQISR